MRSIYCISGLGADQRIFSHLEIPNVRLLHLPWLIPAADEPIEAYALRMKAGIEGDNPVLLGLSFGGMMAVEIARHCPGARVILLSSIPDRQSLPWWMRLCGRLRLNRLMPGKPGKGMGWLENYYLGVETEEDAGLVRAFKEKSDPRYLHWAIDRILNWRNEIKPGTFFHVHGGRDRIFPLRRLRPTHVVPDGGHFMVNNRAEAVSRILTDIITAL
ncbi:MAG: alpha/beta hydrolase [Bacteroidetes bacterium]|nr:alpha/beta hydrolase [Bacteroidota bacterium]